MTVSEKKPRLKKLTGRPVGRPSKPIDWNLVDKLLMAGCSSTEIASHFDIIDQTLQDRTVQEKGMLYTEYSAILRSKGESCLRAKQYEKALKGDNTMMVWLGKNRLKQRDTPEQITFKAPNQPEIDYTEIIANLTYENAQLKLGKDNDGNKSKGILEVSSDSNESKAS